jgi:hypothetical protein
MRNVYVPTLVGAALLSACGDGTSQATLGGTTHTQETNATTASLAYGWSRPVTKQAFPAAATKLGSAESILDGHSLQEIVSDAAVRVRSDDQPCVACHAWSTTTSRASFCDRIPAFLALPTAKGNSADPIAAKPQVLKDLLDRWHAAGCPD